MKKIISVIIIALSLIALVVIEQIYIDTTLNGLIDRTKAIQTSVDTNENINSEQILNSINELDEFWTTNEKILCITINHNDLNKVGEQIKKIKTYIEQNNKDDSEYELDVLLFYAKNYQHIMELNFQNVF